MMPATWTNTNGTPTSIGKYDHDWPFSGRDAELEKLHSSLDLTGRGTPQFVVVRRPIPSATNSGEFAGFSY
jgi:hypothetical protein